MGGGGCWGRGEVHASQGNILLEQLFFLHIYMYAQES